MMFVFSTLLCLRKQFKGNIKGWKEDLVEGVKESDGAESRCYYQPVIISQQDFFSRWFAFTFTDCH